MDAESLFKLFKTSVEHKSDEQIEIEILESAHYNIKMFIKHVTNVKNFQIKIIYMARKGDDPKLKQEKEMAEYIGYNKAFSHLAHVNLNLKEHLHDLDLINPFDMGYCLQVTKKYFLSIEDFDKVAFIHDTLEFMERRYENIPDDLEISE